MRKGKGRRLEEEPRHCHVACAGRLHEHWAVRWHALATCDLQCVVRAKQCHWQDTHQSTIAATIAACQVGRCACTQPVQRLVGLQPNIKDDALGLVATRVTPGEQPASEEIHIEAAFARQKGLREAEQLRAIVAPGTARCTSMCARVVGRRWQRDLCQGR